MSAHEPLGSDGDTPNLDSRIEACTASSPWRGGEVILYVDDEAAAAAVVDGSYLGV